MIKTLSIIFISLLVIPATVFAEAVPGKAAPGFEVKDITGKVHTLSDYSGQWLVLEWFNKDCPFVKKHYESGNMQSLQSSYRGKGVSWLSVISSAKGKQGYLEPEEAATVFSNYKATPSAILLDVEGKVGRGYGAKATPTMYVINPQGNVVYAGGIDDNDSPSADVIPTSKNFVSAALDAAMKGKPVEIASAKAYGCSVKY